MFDTDLKTELKKKIADVVTAEGRAPVSNIVSACAEVADVAGDYDFDMLDRPNAVLWPNLTGEMIVAFRELVAEGTIIPIPVFGDMDLILLVFSAGGKPELPIATGLPKRGFKSRRWVPVAFSRPEPALVSAMNRERLREAAFGAGVRP